MIMFKSFDLFIMQRALEQIKTYSTSAMKETIDDCSNVQTFRFSSIF